MAAYSKYDPFNFSVKMTRGRICIGRPISNVMMVNEM